MTRSSPFVERSTVSQIWHAGGTARSRGRRVGSEEFRVVDVDRSDHGPW
jgi:hypothetical protein